MSNAGAIYGVVFVRRTTMVSIEERAASELGVLTWISGLTEYRA